MKSETMGIVTELRSTCETKLPHIKTKKANENKEILNLKSYTVCRDNLRENLEECKDVDELFLLHTLTNFCGGEIEPKREYCPIYCKQLQDNIHCKSTFFVLQFLFGINFFDK